MECMWVLRVLLIILIGSLGVKVKGASGFHASAQCVQLGQANYNRKSGSLNYKTYNDSRGQKEPGYYTIGAYKFTTTHWFLDASFGGHNNVFTPGTAPDFIKNNKQNCPYNYNTDYNVDLCPGDDKVKIRTMAVKQNGVVMQGWLHFEVELTDKKDEIMAIYVQVRDEYFNAIGEFVTREDEQCPVHRTLATPNMFQLLPCSSVGFREAKLSNAVFMTRKDLLMRPKLGEMYLAKKDISRGIQFTWRLSEYWCNRHLRFRPEAIIFTKKMWNTNLMSAGKNAKRIRTYRKAASYWLYPHYFGCADIRLEATPLTCNINVIDYTKGILIRDPKGNLVAPWLKDKVKESTLDNDYISNKQQYFDSTPQTRATLNNAKGIWSLKSCHANTRHLNQASFSGRCTHHFEKTPAHDTLQGCNLNAKSAEFDDPALKGIPTYQDHVIQLTINRTRQCEFPCRPPMNLSDLLAIQVFNTTIRTTQKPKLLKYVNIGDSRNASKVEKFWAGRKFHGEMLVFWSMFLIPVGTFASRYMKETAMGYPCLEIHLWFWIHLATTVFGVGMLGCGLLALYDILNTFGRSLNKFSYYHRGVTITSIVLFVLMAVLGGIRPISYKVRIGTMLLHSVMGFLIYFLNLLGIILSTWIPASPSMPNKCDEEGHPIGFSDVGIVTTIWMVLDLFVHLGMSLLQLWIDKKNQVRRGGFCCPFVPFLSENSATDMHGRKLRGLLFLLYVWLSFTFTMAVVGMLAGTEIDKRCRNLTGPSTCEEVWGCSNWAKAYAVMYPMNPTPAPQAAN